MANGTGQEGLAGFWAELKRRRVIRVVVIYLIAGWAVIEIASTVLPNLQVPEWTVTLVTVLVALGFVLAVALAWVFDLGPAGIERTQGETRQPIAPASESATGPAPRDARLPDDHKSIAVLPFVNMSGDSDNEYFSDGIAEEILNLLVKLPKLRVASRTSSFVFKGEKIDIPEAARRLGVETVLEGSVRKQGDRVRITAQLIDASSDSHLWSEVYDRELKDVFAIQDDIARSIVNALQLTLSPREKRALQYVATANSEAYDYYLRGRKYFYSMTAQGFRHAIQMYDRAIALDPEYANAWAGKADTYSQMFRYAEATPENAAQALAASARATELDPASAEAHASRGLALFINDCHEQAEKHFETAILLNGKLFESYFFYALSCSSRGDFEKAIRLYLQAAEVSPENYQPQSFLGLAYTRLGRVEEAERAQKEAVRLIERRLDLNPDDTRALYIGAANLAGFGQVDRARSWAERAYQSAPGEPMVLYNVACTHAVIGEKDRALSLLEKAVQLGWGDRAWLETDSDLDGLRDDPRFIALLERID